MNMRFTASDIANFCKASRDRNPLHESVEYSRKTPFGMPVVHGMLMVIESFRYLGARPGLQLAELSADFRQPVFKDVEYQVGAEEGNNGELKVAVTDGDQLMLGMKLRFAERQGEPAMRLDEDKSSLLGSARALTFPEISAVKPFEIDYAPSSEYVSSLANDKSIKDAGIGVSHLVALMGCSYVVGMELPGREALLRTVSMQFFQDIPHGSGALRMSVEVENVDERFGLVEIHIDFNFMGHRAASAQVKAFLRPTSISNISRKDGFAFKASEELKGKVVLVIGGSRGLGARIVQSMVWRGATVIATYMQCKEEADGLREYLKGASGRLIVRQGDASEESWCRQMEKEIGTEYGRLDVLICNACPPIRSIRFSSNTVSRVNEFVEKSLRLVTVPIGSFMDFLKKGDGVCVLISSQALENYPMEWPHYVAAKAAAEAMLEVLAKQQNAISFIKVRPPKILTDQVNTNLGQFDSRAPEDVAVGITEKIIEAVSNKRRSGSVELLRDFVH